MKMSIFISNTLRISHRLRNLLRVAYFSSQPEHESKRKIGKIVNVAIIGAPNSGKSTLINNITERKVNIMFIVLKV